jgi:glycosyltransferase involved in cell wall biosynthesis
MNLLLRNKELARSYGEAGRQLAKKEFTIERFDRDVLHFIKKVLKDT